MNIAASIWDVPSNDETLVRMWTGGSSATEIAIALGQGITRAAVIGRVHRLKLPKRAKDMRAKPVATGKKGRSGNPGHPSVLSILHRREGRQRADDHRVITTIAQRPHRSPPLPLPDSEGSGVDVTALVGIMDLKHDSCRWPHGDPKDPAFGYCGRTAKPGSSWCPHHHERVFKTGAAS